MNRRAFLKGSTAVGAGLGLGLFDAAKAHAEAPALKISRTTETRSTCPYCSVSCGVIIHTLGDRAKNVAASVVHVEGDPDHPINRGTLCPKGISLKDDISHSGRLKSPKVRRPGSDKWEDISWDDALDRLARHMKDSRDKKTVLKDSTGLEVNRNEGYGFVGGATITSEEGYLTAKFFRAMGCVYLEQQARV